MMLRILDIRKTYLLFCRQRVHEGPYLIMIYEQDHWEALDKANRQQFLTAQFFINDDVLDRTLHWFTFKFYKKWKDYAKRSASARTIQKTCRNWIDKPITADGKVGIACRIMLKYAKEIRRANCVGI